MPSTTVAGAISQKLNRSTDLMFLQAMRTSNGNVSRALTIARARELSSRTIYMVFRINTPANDELISFVPVNRFVIHKLS
jgi:hypothetical protein